MSSSSWTLGVYLANVVPVTAWAIAFSAVASVAVAAASAVEAAAHAPPPFWIRENLAARIPTSRSAQRYRLPSLPTEARAVPANLSAATRRRSEEDGGGADLERRRGRTAAAARILEWSGARVLVLVLSASSPRPPHRWRSPHRLPQRRAAATSSGPGEEAAAERRRRRRVLAPPSSPTAMAAAACPRPPSSPAMAARIGAGPGVVGVEGVPTRESRSASSARRVLILASLISGPRARPFEQGSRSFAGNRRS
uniref:Uncharacterized protein n=1 Tax=Oryza meridionalis TaxID=40149 RepID=A0A0E0DVZ5_9ORYZ